MASNKNKEKTLMGNLNKKQQALVVLGGVAAAYLGLKTVAVAMDPKVHEAVKNSIKATAGSVGRAARNS